MRWRFYSSYDQENQDRLDDCDGDFGIGDEGVDPFGVDGLLFCSLSACRNCTFKLVSACIVASYSRTSSSVISNQSSIQANA